MLACEPGGLRNGVVEVGRSLGAAQGEEKGQRQFSRVQDQFVCIAWVVLGEVVVFVCTPTPPGYQQQRAVFSSFLCNLGGDSQRHDSACLYIRLKF